MIPTPVQSDKYYGIGAANYHSGESVVLFQRHKRRKEIARLLEALLEKHPSGTISVTWDNANTHEDDELEEGVPGAAGHLVLLYLPIYSPWLNPIEMLWRHFRREVTHCEFFETKQALIEAAQASGEAIRLRILQVCTLLCDPTEDTARECVIRFTSSIEPE